MRPGWNPTRRNRNIGTPKQGFGQNNRLTISEPWNSSELFYERLTTFKTVHRTVHEKDIVILVERTQKHCIHACTPDDICLLLNHVPAEDLEDLSIIVLRQPKRKETILQSVWGRYVFLEIGQHRGDAIIIEANVPRGELCWSKSLQPPGLKELDRLRRDGHEVRMTKRHYRIEMSIESNRATQLYRTLLHEIGHHVDWMDSVERPSKRHEDDEANRDRLSHLYRARPSREREDFAHGYADNLRNQLEAKAVLPFERILDPASLAKDNLRLSDFFVPAG